MKKLIMVVASFVLATGHVHFEARRAEEGEQRNDASLDLTLPPDELKGLVDGGLLVGQEVRLTLGDASVDKTDEIEGLSEQVEYLQVANKLLKQQVAELEERLAMYSNSLRSQSSSRTVFTSREDEFKAGNPPPPDMNLPAEGSVPVSHAEQKAAAKAAYRESQLS